eukprot:3281474-Pleurochrysis_carterae.AAC.1
MADAAAIATAPRLRSDTLAALNAASSSGESIGGAGIPVRNETYALLSNPRFRSHRKGGACTLSFALNDTKLKVASVYAPAEGTGRAAFLSAIADMIYSSKILSGDFSCVDDPFLDTQCSSNPAYSNEGSETLKAIVDKHSLCDEIREQQGCRFGL